MNMDNERNKQDLSEQLYGSMMPMIVYMPIIISIPGQLYGNGGLYGELSGHKILPGQFGQLYEGLFERRDESGREKEDSYIARTKEGKHILNKSGLEELFDKYKKENKKKESIYEKFQREPQANVNQ